MIKKEWYWQESECCGANIKWNDICVECGEHTEIIEICSE